MLARAIAVALLVAATFGVATPLVAAAIKTPARCCHTTACPMMKRQSSSARWAACDADANRVTRSGNAPVVLTSAVAFAQRSSSLQTFIDANLGGTTEATFAVERPPRLLLI
jgi:hypothetical protein